MNTEDKFHALGIMTPTNHALGSSLKMAFEVDFVPQFCDLIQALDLAAVCGPSAPQPSSPAITTVDALASVARPVTTQG